MKNKTIISLLFLALLLITANFNILEAAEAEKLDYQILEIYDHDPEAFTQGLEIYEGKLFEGTGLYGKSTLRKVDLESSQILKIINLDEKYFGEGITILNDRIYQLSWKENTAFVYDPDFNLLKTFTYQGEGWGLANDGQNLIMSNGSEYLYYRNPKTFELIKKIEVTNNKQKVNNINELEYHNGFIYANVWQTDYIIKINAENGSVTSYLDLNGILKTDYEGKIDVLNGIAYDPKNDNFLVTGKLWPKIYRIKIKK